MTIAVALNATRKAIEGTVGTSRAMLFGALSGQGYQGLNDEALAARLRVRPRYDLIVESSQRTNGVGPESADRNILQVNARVRIGLKTEHEILEDLRATVRSDAFELAEDVRQALCFPGNLANDGTFASGIVSGCWTQSGPAREVTANWAKRIYEVELPIKCLVLQSLENDWNPSRIGNLSAWLDETGQQVSGSNITGWTNRMAPAMPNFLGYDSLIAGAYPTTATLNGLAAADFNGVSSTQRLCCYSAITNGIQKTRWHCFVACEVDDVSTNSANHWDNVGVIADTGRNWGILLRKVAGQIKASGYSYGTSSHVAEVDIAAGFHIFEFWADGTNLWFRVDGGTAVSTGVTPLGIERPIYLGGNGFNLAPNVNTFDGRVGEVCLFRDEISVSNSSLMNAYLQDKWAP